MASFFLNLMVFAVLFSCSVGFRLTRGVSKVVGYDQSAKLSDGFRLMRDVSKVVGYGQSAKLSDVEAWKLEDQITSMIAQQLTNPSPTLKQRQNLVRALGDVLTCDLLELTDGFVITAAMPGVKVESVSVAVDDDDFTCTIAASIEEQFVEDGSRYHPKEIMSGDVDRTFKFPRSADLSKVTAVMEEGILTISVPKNPDIKKTKKSIPIANSESNASVTSRSRTSSGRYKRTDQPRE